MDTSHLSKRKRTTVACNFCRARKTRCDGVRPTCGPCRLLDLECVSIDKRNRNVRQRLDVSGSRKIERTVEHFSPSTRSSREDFSQTPATSQHALTQHGHMGAPTPSDSMSLTSRREPVVGSGTRYQGRLPMMPRLKGNNSAKLSAAWLELAFRRLGLSHATRMSRFLALPDPSVQPPILGTILMTPPLFPPSSEIQVCIRQFVHSVNDLFSILSEEDLSRLQLTAETDLDPETVVNQFGVGSLALLYLIVVMAEGPEQDSSTVARNETYLNICGTLLGFLEADISLSSLKALLLYSLVLRQTGELARAWHILNLAFAMESSLGLHRTTKPTFAADGPSRLPIENSQRYALWRSMYCFDKILSFELGRPPCVRELHNGMDTPISSNDMEGISTNTTTFLELMSGFAKVLSHIHERSTRLRNSEEMSPDDRIEVAIREKITGSVELSLKLARFAETWPEGLRYVNQTLGPQIPAEMWSRADVPILCDSSFFPHAQFLLVQYNFA